MTVSDGARSFAESRDVSRETLERLDLYIFLLRKWNPRINLVSARSLDEVWVRHVADSAQIHALGRFRAALWVDLGSGGGFPGLVVAILAVEAEPALRIALIESDTRKATFLAEVARQCALSVEIVNARLERVKRLEAGILSARALAPLSRLLEFAERHAARDGICLFQKGETVHKEIAAARSAWRFEPRLHASHTNPGSFIVEIGEFQRV